ncbi:hypothetical protein BpHYR1_046498 [Brachionus plicatilis]|uniref:Uncharacterized protein n=1 Tax=Brachionus plicatilis TaxID=10195 RepID=A0A3M7QQU8_BRAPC|nr:hypothetical protein BpHYR1_046498 [Brachionus plicatilis]
MLKLCDQNYVNKWFKSNEQDCLTVYNTHGFDPNNVLPRYLEFTIFYKIESNEQKKINYSVFCYNKGRIYILLKLLLIRSV